jgi:cobalamin biosynthesis Co2+ chelatase CbiK
MEAQNYNDDETGEPILKSSENEYVTFVKKVKRVMPSKARKMMAHER